MDITVGITINPTAIGIGHEWTEEKVREYAEEALVHKLVADNGFVMSALVLRKRDNGVSVPWYEPDENTRQSR